MFATHAASHVSHPTGSSAAGVPALRLSVQGAACIDRWVLTNASRLAVQSLDAWHRYAESTANSTPAGETIAIEMAMSLTKSGYPEELRCPREWFVAG